MARNRKVKRYNRREANKNAPRGKRSAYGQFKTPAELGYLPDRAGRRRRRRRAAAAP